MSQLQIETKCVQFQPGEVFHATATWGLETRPPAIEWRLMWIMSSRDRKEQRTVKKFVYESPALSGKETKEFRIPHGPYSFRGKLISLEWKLELIAGKRDRFELPLMVMPGKEEIVLETVKRPEW